MSAAEQNRRREAPMSHYPHLTISEREYIMRKTIKEEIYSII